MNIVLPKAKPARYRVWQAIRIYRRFKNEDLIALGIQAKSVRNYVSVLRRNGIVRSLSDGYTMLVRDVGPLPPIEQPDGTISDPNAKRVHAVEAQKIQLQAAQRLGCINCKRTDCGACLKAKLEKEGRLP